MLQPHLVRETEIVPDLISIFTAQIHVISQLHYINVLYFVYVVQLQSNRLSFDVILLIGLGKKLINRCSGNNLESIFLNGGLATSADRLEEHHDPHSFRVSHAVSSDCSLI